MPFTLSFDTSSAAGLADLDMFIRGRSYVVGFHATQADVELFNALGKAPDASKYANLARFYAHIASFSAEARKAFPGAFSKGGASASAKGGKDAGKAAAKPAAAPAPAEEEDDAADLFGDDDDDAAAKKIAAKAAASKKEEPKKDAKKPAAVDKSGVVYEVKPLEAGQDMKELETKLRSIVVDGLLWGQEFKVVDVAFGIQKLVVQAVCEDEKLTTDDLEEKMMTALEGLISSVDLLNINKVAGR